ncbi:MAG: hypothetical protein OXH85_02390 [Truepera sp.]|nr:hypothetical protein [Truepera sp.]
MLQIASGKLFTKAPIQRNELRGVLYTNLFLFGDKPIETVAGRLLPTSSSFVSRRGQLVYEITELIEGSSPTSWMVSHGIDSYLYDFAAVVSIALNVTCTVTPENKSRLIGGQQSAKVGGPPCLFIPRVFDRQIRCEKEELDVFVKFVDDLIALKRKSFLAAMRAIRTYVVGLHRLADDLELAYTLFVVSIESLAQGFDEFQPEWDDYDGAQRIDIALANADEDTSQRVREALLQIEQEKGSLARRFREFAIAHVGDSFFREEAIGVQGAASRVDLVEALQGAYRLRSRYVHNLHELPGFLIAGKDGDILRMEGITQFTFQGIARLARHVIFEFINRQPKVEKEEYDYTWELPRVLPVGATLPSGYWTYRPEDLRLALGTGMLVTFLNQVSLWLSNDEGAKLTDLRLVLSEAEKLFASSSEEGRRPLLALYMIFNELVSDDKRMANWAKIKGEYGAEIAKPSIEGMLVRLILRASPDWSLAEYQRIYDDYFRQRGTKRGLRIPRTLEAGIALELAEQYRLEGDIDRAQELLGSAVEHYPGHEPLCDIEKNFAPECAIDWFGIIFPAMAKPDGGGPSGTGSDVRLSHPPTRISR